MRRALLRALLRAEERQRGRDECARELWDVPSKLGRQRAAEKRVRALLLRSKLLFIRVGGRVGEDEVVSAWTELSSGATTASRQFNAIIRQLVETARGA